MQIRDLKALDHRIFLGHKNQMIMKQFVIDPTGPVIVLHHGVMSDSKIFYSPKLDKGLAIYLAKKGYNVFAINLRGTGGGLPSLFERKDRGHQQIIVEDLQIAFDSISNLSGHKKQSWIAHSWGGVQLIYFLAHVDHSRWNLKSLVFFSSRRRIQINSLKKWIQLKGYWDFYLSNKFKNKHYISSKKIGNSPISQKTFEEIKIWMKQKDWKDFDETPIKNLLSQRKLPRILHLTGASDRVLGHPKDIENFMNDIGPLENQTFKIVGKKTKFKHNYGHASILTHPDAPMDHFQFMRQWIKTQF